MPGLLKRRFAAGPQASQRRADDRSRAARVDLAAGRAATPRVDARAARPQVSRVAQVVMARPAVGDGRKDRVATSQFEPGCGPAPRSSASTSTAAWTSHEPPPTSPSSSAATVHACHRPPPGRQLHPRPRREPGQIRVSRRSRRRRLRAPALGPRRSSSPSAAPCSPASRREGKPSGPSALNDAVVTEAPSPGCSTSPFPSTTKRSRPGRRAHHRHPVGSTAHSLSAGGLIVHPDLEAFIVTPSPPRFRCARSSSRRQPALRRVRLAEEAVLTLDRQVFLYLRDGDRTAFRRPNDLLCGHRGNYYGTLCRKRTGDILVSSSRPRSTPGDRPIPAGGRPPAPETES